MTNAQEWLEQNYSNKQTKEIKTSPLENLHDSLIIADYPELEKVNIQDQKNLTNLQITNCPNLRKLTVRNSQLTNLNLTELGFSQNSKLAELSLSNNNLRQDLSFLSHLVNLKKLELENNSFVGGLEFLENLSKLETLDISETDIDSGLEYLPESLSDEVKFPDYQGKKHSEAVYTSRLLPTKEISNLITQQYSDSLAIDFSQLNLKDKTEESRTSTEQNQEQQPQIIHNPPIDKP